MIQLKNYRKKKWADVNKIMKIALEIKKSNENIIKEILFFYDVNFFKKKNVKLNNNKKDKDFNNKREDKKYDKRNCITINYIHVNPSLFKNKK